MLENILFYGFAACCVIYGISTLLIKYILKQNGYFVPWLNTDLSDFKNLRLLAKQEKKYRPLYFLYITLTVIAFSLIILIVITMFGS
jgi:hypothetical protein